MDRHLRPLSLALLDPPAQLYCSRDVDNRNRRREQPQWREIKLGFGLTSEGLLFRTSVKSGVGGRVVGQRWGLGSSDCVHVLGLGVFFCEQLWLSFVHWINVWIASINMCFYLLRCCFWFRKHIDQGSPAGQIWTCTVFSLDPNVFSVSLYNNNKIAIIGIQWMFVFLP